MDEATLTKLAMAEVAIEDVRRSSPAEEPDEKRVMDYIERNDVTGRNSKYFDAATSIPSELASQVSTKTEQFEDTHSNQESENNNNKDMDDELFAITNSINRLHFQMHANQNSDGSVAGTRKDPKVVFPGTVFRGNESVPQSEGDRFAANAGKLFHGYSKSNGFFRRNKKNSQQKTRAGDDHSDLESNTDTGKHASSFYAKKMKIASLESLQEFKSVVASKRGYVWSYVRDTLFFVIIPSTLLAAMYVILTECLCLHDHVSLFCHYIIS